LQLKKQVCNHQMLIHASKAIKEKWKSNFFQVEIIHLKRKCIKNSNSMIFSIRILVKMLPCYQSSWKPAHTIIIIDNYSSFRHLNVDHHQMNWLMKFPIVIFLLLLPNWMELLQFYLCASFLLTADSNCCFVMSIFSVSKNKN